MLRSWRPGRSAVVLGLMAVAYISGTAVECALERSTSKGSETPPPDKVVELQSEVLTLQERLRLTESALKESDVVQKSAIEWLIRLEGENRKLAADVRTLAAVPKAAAPSVPAAEQASAPAGAVDTASPAANSEPIASVEPLPVADTPTPAAENPPPAVAQQPPAPIADFEQLTLILSRLDAIKENSAASSPPTTSGPPSVKP